MMKIDFLNIGRLKINSGLDKDTKSTDAGSVMGEAASADKKATTEKMEATEKTTTTEKTASDQVAETAATDEAEIEKFEAKMTGTETEKAQTVAYVRRKGLPMTQGVLSAVHMALKSGNGPTVEALLALQTSDVQEGLGTIERIDLNEVLKSALIELEKLSTVNEGVFIDSDGGIDLSELVDEIRTVLAEGGEIQELLVEKVGRLLEKASILMLADVIAGSKQSEKKSDASSVSSDVFKDIGSVATADSTGTINEKDVVESEDGIQNDGEVTEEISALEDFLGELEKAIELQIQNLNGHMPVLPQQVVTNRLYGQVLRVEVTQEMISAKVEFHSFRKDISEKMAGILERTGGKEQDKANRIQAIRQLVQKTDNFIMKGNCMLYTSMKNERDLLRISSDLQDVIRSLETGKIAEAERKLGQAFNRLNDMVFEPSKRRVELRVGDLSHVRLIENSSVSLESDAASSNHELENVLRRIAGKGQLMESSPRMMLELMRDLGLNHEVEQSVAIEQKGLSRQDSGDEVKDSNLKRILMEMAEQNAEEKGAEPIKRALDTLMGTQLSNKYESGTQEQSMLFMIPLGNELDNTLRVMVNGRKKQEGLDWENCNLYLAMDSKRFGPIGIKVNIQNRLVSLTLYNDNANERERFGSAVDKLMDGLQEIGYKKGRSTLTSFVATRDNVKNHSVNEVLSDKTDTVRSEGRFDLKI